MAFKLGQNKAYLKTALDSLLGTVNGTGFKNGIIQQTAAGTFSALTKSTSVTAQSTDNEIPTAAAVKAAVDGATPVWGNITGTLSAQTDLQNALNAKVPTSRKVNGHALTSDVTITDTEIAHGSSTVGASLDSTSTQIANNIGRSGWNQLLKNNNFANAAEWNASNATISIAGNTVLFTATAQNGYLSQRYPRIIGHKYLTFADVKASSSTIRLFVGGTGVNVRHSGSGEWETLAVFQDSTVATEGNTGLSETGTSFSTAQMKNINLIDLTILYGKGNEPSTLAEFKADYPQKFYPYCNPTNGMVGDAWVSSKNYAVGEYCIDYNILYRCKVAHTNQRPPNTTYWTQTSVGAELTTTSQLLSPTNFSGYGIKFYKFGIIKHVHVDITATADFAAWSTIATIPTDFRPISYTVTQRLASNSNLFLSLGVGGTLQISTSVATGGKIQVDLSYI